VARQPALSYSERIDYSEHIKRNKERVIPDIVFDGADLSLATDVSVVYGEAPSYVAAQEAKAGVEARERLLALIKGREKEKRNTYVEVCKQQYMSFEPFVVESHGFLGEAVGKVVDVLAKYGGEVLGVSVSEARGYLMRRTAVAIQRGNASLDRIGVQKSRGSFEAMVAMGYRVHSDSQSSHSRSAAAKRKRGSR
jgi:hypothetical protein